MTNFVGRLGVTLGLNSAEFTRGIEQAESKLEGFGTKLATYGKVAATAFAAASVAAMRYADEIVDVAKANDVAISSIIQLRNALANSGGEASNASKLLSSFIGFIDKAAEGSFEAQKTLKSLGVSMSDLRTLSIDELFRKTAEGLSQMDDTLTRNAKAMDVFGKAAKGVDFAAFNDELGKLNTGQLKKHEEGLQAAADAWDNLGEISRRVMEKMAATIGPTMKFITDELKKLEQGMKFQDSDLWKMLFPQIQYGSANKPSAAQAPTATPEDIAAMANMGKAVAKPSARVVKPGVDKDAEAERRRILDNWAKGYLAVQQEIREGNEAIAKQALELAQKEIDEIERRKEITIRARQQEANEIEEGKRLIAEQASEYQKAEAALKSQQNVAGEILRREEVMLELSEKARLMKAQDVQLAQEVLAIQWRYADAVKKINETENLTAEARQKALREQLYLSNQEMDIAQRRYELMNRVRTGSFAQGFEEAAMQSVENAMSAFKAGQQTFDVLMSSMENAITRFVQTGKLSFKDLARSIISDIIAIQMRAQISRLFGLVGSVGVPVNMGPNLVNQELGSSFNQYLAGASARADGGPVIGGSPYLVGERGPELFVPRGSGAIVPTNHLAAMMGGGQTVNYNGPVIQNMSAIDTQSGLEFLSRNKQAVWAANQSAQRSLPMNR